MGGVETALTPTLKVDDGLCFIQELLLRAASTGASQNVGRAFKVPLFVVTTWPLTCLAWPRESHQDRKVTRSFSTLALSSSQSFFSAAVAGLAIRARISPARCFLCSMASEGTVVLVLMFRLQMPTSGGLCATYLAVVAGRLAR
jgi:hypothetical protein